MALRRSATERAKRMRLSAVQPFLASRTACTRPIFCVAGAFAIMSVTALP